MINDDAGSIIAARLFLFLINDPTISCNYYSRHSCNARLKRTDSNSINRNRKSGGKEGLKNIGSTDTFIYLFIAESDRRCGAAETSWLACEFRSRLFKFSMLPSALFFERR